MGSAADQALLSQLKGSGPGGMPTQQDAQNQQAKKEQEEGMRQDLLTRVMAPEAKERLNRISLVKPDKAASAPSRRPSLHGAALLTLPIRRRRASSRTWSS